MQFLDTAGDDVIGRPSISFLPDISLELLSILSPTADACEISISQYIDEIRTLRV